MIMHHGIGEAARRSGCTVQTIRYYERIGLVAPATRTSGNQRVYDEGAVDRLSFIRHARALGFKLEAVRELLDLSANSDRTCEEIDAIARAHLEAVRERIGRLRVLEAELARMVEACKHETVAECRVVQVLSNHALCETDHPVVA
jgi:DNA-binding transcriptional MerR regulator